MVIKYQKRGLLHCLMLIILHNDYKPRNTGYVDRLTQAEIPNTCFERRLHNIPPSNMIHGPCDNSNASCWSYGCCSKQFLKTFSDRTSMDLKGYPQYRRCNTGIIGYRDRAIDKRWIVPYSPYLLFAI